MESICQCSGPINELLFGLQSLLRHSENGTAKYLFCKWAFVMLCLFVCLYPMDAVLWRDFAPKLSSIVVER